MKETNDRAMELLLRRHAQRNLRAFNGHGTAGEAPSAHLDADELNALAENALPQAARARYFSHLADCASCRKLATALATTAATTAGRGVESAPGQKERGPFWQMLATLVSLPLMRYGVPVLTVLILAVVGFVVLRPGPSNEFVAQNNEDTSLGKDTRPSITSTPEASTHVAPQPTVQQDAVSTGSSAPSKDVREEQPLVASKKPGASGYSGAANALPPEFAPEPSAASDQAKDLFKNTPTTAAAPPAAAKSAARDNNMILMDKVQADESLAKRGETNQVKDEQVSRRAVESLPAGKFGGLASESKQKGGPRRSQQQQESEGRNSSPANPRSSDASAQTRSVGGHRFRREGNTWVDAAYDSSRTVTTLSRNSDQYRKLANDNAGLRAIVDELGSVIVVWNGKQYRIH